MPPLQPTLFKLEKPLEQRLGREFFLKLPSRPGIYRMRDADGNILYVGKAKDLKKRLNSYRAANPDRTVRRQLRLLARVRAIDFELCASESKALKAEAKLIRELKPKFNKAGKWQGPPKFLVWRFEGTRLEMACRAAPLNGWERAAFKGSQAARFRALLLRLIWLKLNPHGGHSQLPPGWWRGTADESVPVDCRGLADEIRQALANFFWGDPARFIAWIGVIATDGRNAFDKKAMEMDLEEVAKFLDSRNEKGTGQMALI